MPLNFVSDHIGQVLHAACSIPHKMQTWWFHFWGRHPKTHFVDLRTQNWCESIENTLFRLQQHCLRLIIPLYGMCLPTMYQDFSKKCFTKQRMMIITIFQRMPSRFYSKFTHIRPCLNPFNSFIWTSERLSSLSLSLTRSSSLAIYRISRSLVLFQ